ncbi:MAG: hypothetical protein AB8H80_23075 [Planctomycetota bacterium]
MSRPSTLLLLLLALPFVPTACGTFDYSADFATNELFYADVPFQTKAPGDRDIFVAPIADLRADQVLPPGENGFPIQYGGDEFWQRSVPDMLSDVLWRQVEDSDLFVEVLEAADPEAVVMKPELLAFTVGAQEGMSGSMTFAEVRLRLQVFGPQTANGERPLWHDETFGNRQRSEYMVKPVSPYRLVGRALQLTMQKSLSSLDGSNVARSGVPIDAIEAAPDVAAEAVPAAPAAEANATRR